jgi:hypothetical protein
MGEKVEKVEKVEKHRIMNNRSKKKGREISDGDGEAGRFKSKTDCIHSGTVTSSWWLACHGKS